MKAWPLLAVALISAPRSLSAQDAGALFDRGVDALEAGKFAEACPLLDESYRLEPKPGTLFTLAECEAKNNQPAMATRHYEEYLRQIEGLPPAQRGKHTERQQKASDAIKKLEPRIARVTLVGAPADAEVTLDGKPIESARLSSPLAVDEGSHSAVVRRQGAERTTTFQAQAGSAPRVTLEVPAPPAAASSAPPPASAPPPPTSAPSSALPFYAAAGVGAAGLLVGTIGGVVALSKKSTADEKCPQLACSPAGYDAVTSGRQAATVSTVGFVVGGVFLAGAAALWLTGFSSPVQPSTALRLSPTIGRGEGGLALGGAW